MRAIVGAIGWKGSDFDSVRICAELTDHSGEVGIAGPWRIAREGRATFGCSPQPTTGARQTVGIVSREGITVVADARLVERDELFGNLNGAGTEDTDAQLVHAAYLKWGADFVTHLRGDFAAIVYDQPRNEAVLATGGSGARQLYYSRGTSGVVITSVAALIQRSRGLGVNDLDPLTVRGYLLGHFEEGHRTFFAGITRVPPGHRVIVSAAGADSRRFWMPPERVLDLPRETDYFEAFAALFQKCVSDAVDPGARHVVHLSGGLDSSSIVKALSRLDGGGASFEIIDFAPRFRMYGRFYRPTGFIRLIRPIHGAEYSI